MSVGGGYPCHCRRLQGTHLKIASLRTGQNAFFVRSKPQKIFRPPGSPRSAQSPPNPRQKAIKKRVLAKYLTTEEKDPLFAVITDARAMAQLGAPAAA